jgi:dipeptidyl aminopeptidase/acylaminoacyl peptidase
MTEALPDLIPLEVIYGNPEKASPQLSPDSTRMAYLAPVNDVLNVWVGEVGKNDYRAVTNDTDRGIRAYGWAHDNRHILYIQDVGGDENWHVYSVDLESAKVTDMTPFDNVQVRFVGFDKHFPNDVLLGINKDDPRIHDVYRLELDGGTLELVAKNPGNLVGWVADRSFNVRACMRPRPDGGFDLLVRDGVDDEWRELLTWGLDDSRNSRPVGFNFDGSRIFLIDSRDANAGSLVSMDVQTGRSEVIAADPHFDVTLVQTNPDTFEIEAVGFYKDRLDWQILDRRVQDDFDAIRQIQHGEFYIVNRDHSDDTWLIWFTVDDGPISYWKFDRSSKEATFLFHQRSDLSKYRLAKRDPCTFTTRDGLAVHGYITFPLGIEPRNLPMVVYVHGGPWSRDVWGFHPTAQWLANRGYICLQVNYRGSTGYGKKFLNAGNREWGAKMHDDLIDAVEWVISKGYADRSRVAIMGGSYGGYATLVGATFTPDVFACAVAIVGPSNLKTLIETIPPYWKPTEAQWHARVGHPDKDEPFLWSRSPLSKVDQISKPLLIGHGKNDPRVKLSESLQIVEAMKEKGIDHEFMLFDDEGHGFVKPENRLTFYRAAERFLAKHIGGRAANEV